MVVKNKNFRNVVKPKVSVIVVKPKVSVIERDFSIPNLNYKEMRKVCAMKPTMLAKKYGLTHHFTKKGSAWFKDNGADILAVAHVDSILPFLHFDVARMRQDTWIFCPTLDDRLGCYMLLDYLPKAGVKYDILLTDNEEKGASTAGAFAFPHDRKYKWMFMMDRNGSDVVMYDFYNYSTASKLYKFGYPSVGRGSYSCIADLADIGCQGFNFGIGYHNNHSHYAYASRNEILKSTRRFLSFYREHGEEYFPHIDKRFEQKYRDYYEPQLYFREEIVDLSNEFDFNTSLNNSDFDWGNEDYPVRADARIVGGLVPEIIPEAKVSYVGTHDPISSVAQKVSGSEDVPIVEQIKIGYQKNKMARANEKIKEAKEQIKASIAVFLASNINLLAVPDELANKLRDNGIYCIGEVAQLSRVEFLNLAKVNKEDADRVEAAFKGVHIDWSLNLSEYGITMIDHLPDNQSMPRITPRKLPKRFIQGDLIIESKGKSGEAIRVAQAVKENHPKTDLEILLPCTQCKKLFRIQDPKNGYEKCPDCTAQSKIPRIIGGLKLTQQDSNWTLRSTENGLKWVEKPKAVSSKPKVVGFAGGI